MKTAALLLLALFFSGCGTRAAVVAPGPIAAPEATAGVSGATESLIAGEANATAAGDHKAAKAIGGAIVQQDKAEIAGSDRWLIFTGILVLAVGLGIMYYLGPKLGGGVAIVGAGMIGGAMFVSAILPYREWIAGIGSAVALIALAWHFRAYFHAAEAMAHGTEHLASERVKGLIVKMKARGPGILTRVKALLHHAPIAPKPSP